MPRRKITNASGTDSTAGGRTTKASGVDSTAQGRAQPLSQDRVAGVAGSTHPCTPSSGQNVPEGGWPTPAATGWINHDTNSEYVPRTGSPKAILGRDTKKETLSDSLYSGAGEDLQANADNPMAQLADKNLIQKASLVNVGDPGNLATKTPEMDVPLPTMMDPEKAKATKDVLNASGEIIGKQDVAITESGARIAESAKLSETVNAENAQDTLVSDFEVETIKPSEISRSLAALKNESPMVAASMATELEGLLEGMENGDIPAWAKPAVTQVEKQLAARGISASSVGRDALFNAIIQSAMPIAQQDATFKQDANKSNYAAMVQSLMTDASVENAALQFNATNANQANQFMVNLKSQVDSQNNQRKEAISQFNAKTANEMSLKQFEADQQVELYNVQAADAMTKYAGQLETNIAQFNSQAAQVIQQSNVNWRRQANTANTAIENQVSMTNTMNAFNLSNQGLSNIWQAERDEAAWYEQATQNDLDRYNRLEATVLGNEAGAAAQKGALFANILAGLGDVFNSVERME